MFGKLAPFKRLYLDKPHARYLEPFWAPIDEANNNITSTFTRERTICPESRHFHPRAKELAASHQPQHDILQMKRFLSCCLGAENHCVTLFPIAPTCNNTSVSTYGRGWHQVRTSERGVCNLVGSHASTFNTPASAGAKIKPRPGGWWGYVDGTRYKFLRVLSMGIKQEHQIEYSLYSHQYKRKAIAKLFSIC